MEKTDLFNEWLKETKVYQAGKTFEEIASEYGFDKSEILRLAGNESTIGTSPKAIEAAKAASETANFYAEPKSDSLIKSLEDNFAKDINLGGLDLLQNTQEQGLRESDRTSRNLLTINEGERNAAIGGFARDLGFVCGNGMDSIIEHCLTLFTKPGDSIINLTPTFIYYDFAAHRQGLEIIEVKRALKEVSDNSLSYEVNIDEVINSIQANTKIIFLCSPNNPDGSVVSLEDIKRLAQVCQEKGIVLFIDHAYIDFTDRTKYDARTIVKDFPSMIVGYTFSKAYGLAGFRVGYALMHTEMQEKFLTLLTPFLIAKPSIAAAQAALEDEGHLRKILDNNFSQKLWLELELKALGFKVFNSEANFLLVKPENTNIFEELLQKGIIIREMKALDALRITVGKPDENQRLISAIKEIKDCA